MIILKNWLQIEPEAAMIPILTDEFQYGTALFETMLFRNGKIENLELHMNRLKKSQKILKQKLINKKNLVQTIDNLNLQTEQKIKLICLKNDNYLIITKYKREEAKEIHLKTYRADRSLSILKSSSYIASKLARDAVNEEGYYDALFFDQNGDITECTSSNIFWIEKNEIYTRKDQILGGTKRQEIINKYPVKFAKISKEEITKKACFITNALIGIKKVTTIDDVYLPESDFFSS